VWRFAADGEPELAKLAEHAPGAAVYVRLRTSTGGNTVPSEGKFGVGRRPRRPPAADRRPGRAAPARARLPRRVADALPRGLGRGAAAGRRGAAGAGRGPGSGSDLLDLGGGFPARYADVEPPPLAEFAAAIRAGIAAHLPYRPATLAVEPGRALVAEAGVMVATVIGLAERAGRRWVHLDVGAFNGFMEALETGNRLRFPVTDSRGSALRDAGPPHRADLRQPGHHHVRRAAARSTWPSMTGYFSARPVRTRQAMPAASTASPYRLRTRCNVFPLRLSGERQT
jgi:ornithine decarboxylase